MRTPIACLTLLLCLCSATAQDKVLTPRQSFEAFIQAVLDEDMDAAARNAAFERYFDFDTWLAGREAAEGKTHTEAERTELKTNWTDLFASSEFRQQWKKRNVRVVGEGTIDKLAGTATLTIAMDDSTDPAPDKFVVSMKLSDDGNYWRWYEIPVAMDEAPKLTPEQRIAALEESLARIAAERKRLDELEDAVHRALARLRSDQAEAGDSSPSAVVTAAWTAIEKGNAEALLDCHTTAQVAKVKLADVQAGIEATRERLMEWQVQQPSIDPDDDRLARVPVRLKLRRNGEPDERTITVRVVKVGDAWKIDEAP